MALNEFGELDTESCWGCVVALHAECKAPADGTCCCGGTTYLESPEVATVGSRGSSGPRVLDPGEVTDPTSTGRKRAAMLYPIMPGMVCEWAGLQYAGGGVVPIMGCDWNLIFPSGKAGGEGDSGDIHHGPSKSTLNNTPGNVHRICRSCHHTWHGKNDVFYGKLRPKGGEEWLPTMESWVPHDPFTEASDADIAAIARGRTSTNPRASDEQIAAARLDRANQRRIYGGIPPELDAPELL